LEEARVPRRLAAILAADVVGYSRLMGTDEVGTHARLKGLRVALIDPAIGEHQGRIVKTTGDGILIEFPSVVAAVECAVAVQRGMVERNANVPQDRRIEFRVGINLGDVIVEGEDIIGDGVNVAARLEAMAEPGTICVSEMVRDQVRDRLKFDFADLGEHQLKNIARPMRIWRLVDDAAKVPVPSASDTPSIAVLPFANMSGDPDQEYFADGMVEEIITGLARLKWLFVIARNSSFIYKGKAVDVKQVGRELGVRYVLEGSVRKAGNRLRITGQLIDVANGAHLWADRFDGALEDVFDLQDQVTASVVAAIEPAMRDAELRRTQGKPTSSLAAYDWFLRALAAFNRPSRSRYDDAVQLCRKAIAADPNYAAAYALAAWGYAGYVFIDAAADPHAKREEGAALARRALELGANDPLALAMGGQALAFLSREHDRALAATQRALELNPNSAQAWVSCGHVHQMRGEGNDAVAHFQRAMRLSPRDPLGWSFKTGLALGHFIEGRYAEAADWAEKALYEQPTFFVALRVRIASCGLLGRAAEAKEAVRAALAMDPTASVTNWMEKLGMRTGPYIAGYIEGFRKAGLPE
jgi:TolB-like protein